jgi:hypothetical protein
MLVNALAGLVPVLGEKKHNESSLLPKRRKEGQRFCLIYRQYDQKIVRLRTARRGLPKSLEPDGMPEPQPGRHKKEP